MIFLFKKNLVNDRFNGKLKTIMLQYIQCTQYNKKSSKQNLHAGKSQEQNIHIIDNSNIIKFQFCQIKRTTYV